MRIQKWDEQERVYHDCEVPDDWNVKLYSYDMGEIVNAQFVKTHGT